MVSWSNPDVRPCQGIDLFILYVLFPNSYHSMFSGEFTFCLFIDYAYRCTWIRVHKTTFERNSSLGYHQVVWNGKQNIQAKKFFSSCIFQNPTIRKYSIYMYICTSSSSTALYVWTLNRQFLCLNLQSVAKRKMCHSPMILMQGGWRCIFLPLFLISKVLFNSWDELKAKPSIIKCYVGDQKTCELSNRHHHHSDHRMNNCNPHYETFHYSIYKQILRSLVQFWIHSFIRNFSHHEFKSCVGCSPATEYLFHCRKIVCVRSMLLSL